MSVPRLRRRVLLVSVAFVAAACGPGESRAQTDRPPSSTVRAAGAGLVLEFDAPVELSQPAGSPNAVTAFRVGFFRPGQADPVRTMDVARRAVTVQGGTARLDVPRDGLSACGAGCAIRLQTVAGAATSAWSEPVAASGPGPAASRSATPAPPRVIRPAGPVAPGARATGRTPPGLSPSDVERHPALLAALKQVLPKGASLEAEARRFRRVDQLALVVVVSRDHGVPFAELARAVTVGPRQGAQAALAKLRPDLDARDVIRTSRVDAQKLIASTGSNAPAERRN